MVTNLVRDIQGSQSGAQRCVLQGNSRRALTDESLEQKVLRSIITLVYGKRLKRQVDEGIIMPRRVVREKRVHGEQYG
jgi:hypothetical protein